ncbi:Transposable element Tcb2 transposase [Araneus ventricosus]|uniref:Transposable element Tcb2 transposase n=1 Tax=Araneus ventricosus TaxID=182803 RepID=A0A4Y2DRD9_ARAVE|nr:Transposable element Tcb2 transposase [Araneus ventricosus]
MAQRKHLDDFLRGRIIRRLECGHTQLEVSEELGIAQSIISRLWQRFQDDGNVSRCYSTGRPRVTTPNEDRYLAVTAKRNRRSTASDLSRQLSSATGTTVSRQTVYRRLGHIVLYARRPVRCVPLTATHCRLRLAWSREHALWTPQQWSCVMFSDESRFSLQSDSRRTFIWRAPGTCYHQENTIERHRYGGAGWLVWGGIILGSRTDLHVQSVTMTGHIYRDVILEQHVRLFRGAMGAEFLFMDDNARPHRANIVDECLQSEDITRMDWPAYSLDLNPIEHVWDMLGRRIAARQPPPTCLPELRRALLDEWCNIPQDQIDNLILSMPRRYGDLISIFDSSDLSFAIQCSRILKLTIFVNGHPEPLQSDEVKHIRTELQKIRNQVNQLIDQLEPRAPLPGSRAENEKGVANAQANSTPNAAAPKEFDPLSSKEGGGEGRNKVSTSFGLQEDGRGGSPDSISSLGSSASQKQPQQMQQGVPPPTSMYQTQPHQVYVSSQNNPGVPSHHYFPGSGGPGPHQQQQQQQQPQSPASSVGSGFAPPPPSGYGSSQPGPGYGSYQQNPQMQQAQYGQPQPSQGQQQQMPQQVRGSPFAGPPASGPSQGQTGAPSPYQGGPPTSQAFQGQMQYPAGYSPGPTTGPVPSGPGPANPYSRGSATTYARPTLNYQAGY